MVTTNDRHDATVDKELYSEAWKINAKMQFTEVDPGPDTPPWDDEFAYNAKAPAGRVTFETRASFYEAFDLPADFVGNGARLAKSLRSRNGGAPAPDSPLMITPWLKRKSAFTWPAN